ncbi:TIGR03364 family FAD-dependent oxidoreductase [Mycolicibacterium wolinskyi]|uniref:Oxidoreductase n=1 Tax=Mycolicibacterium wolinskyi TaxID=59750 RepID=A0A1X2FH16_9MYCO|nr:MULTISPECIES: TIGR03364 family FAD-dependent oxidoreductase [Mycolicibacterium]MCV7285331.1 TIGR03364 family FAD-dependent oxidoreductase [Mycolicibacterium wolinskyi]MCV7295166.1 TIGR03364 family FAD-dependent oxidoreductase [Mycolicibacterium goodii]ORX17732.1 oxidoreductase [Mycolicibacterium wolinskyi]
MGNQQHYDVVVVGAGIVGLAHAYHAHQRGLTVAVIDHADGVVGASVQNFGHACITAQSGVALTYARKGRGHWLNLSRQAGFWSAEAGTFCVARHDDELAVMNEFATTRPAGDVILLDREQILDRIPVRAANVTGGMYLPNDLQVDPRTAAPSIARWLSSVGVDFYWRTAATGFAHGVVHTSRGPLRAGTTFVTVNYDIDRLFPALAERDGLLRCRLHMLRARLPLAFALPAPLFTGWSLVRYSGFENLPSTAALAERLRAEHPDYVAIDLHQMYTPQRDGSLLIGDTHYRDVSTSPFQSEEGFAVLVEEARKLFGVNDIEISERWQGVYSSAPGQEFLIEEPIERTHVVTVTTGIGMTTSMGLAQDSVENALTRDGVVAHV